MSKKVLSFVLAVVMALGIFGAGTPLRTASAFDASMLEAEGLTPEELAETIETLKAMGIDTSALEAMLEAILGGVGASPEAAGEEAAATAADPGDTTGAAGGGATPTASTVLVNGQSVAFDAYLINGNNYFKLRDLAYTINGTEKQFEVGWDGAKNAISLTSGRPYTAVGGEMAGKGGGAKTPEPTNSKIIQDGGKEQFTAYLIDGNNYFMLRDIGAAFDFGVDWDGDRNTIVIDTSKGYITPDPVSAANLRKPTQAETLSIASKYYSLARPNIETGKSDFDKAVNWNPAFDGQKKDYALAGALAYENVQIAFIVGAPNLSLALAGAVFDIASDDRTAALNLGSAIAMFCDGSADAAVRARENEIYADAETAMLYAISMSLVNGDFSHGSLEPLVALGNLYLDMDRLEDARGCFEAALGVKPYYRPALEGMMIYYLKTNKPHQSVVMRKAAKNDKTEVGKEADEVEKNNEQADDLVEKGMHTEAELEEYLNRATKIKVISYADFFKELDPKTTKAVADSQKTIKDKMKITIPDISLLTHFSDVNKTNYDEVSAAAQAVGGELEFVGKYAASLAPSSMNTTADMLDATGIKITIDGMNMSEFLRKMAKNPDQEYDGPGEGDVDMDSVYKYIGGMMSGIFDAMSGGTGGDAVKAAGQADPLYKVMAKNPFNYANSFDILIQQYNVVPLVTKMNALAGYLHTVGANDKLVKLKLSYVDDAQKLHEEELVDWKAYSDWNEAESRRIDAMPDGDSKANALERHMIEQKQKTHAIHTKWYPKWNAMTQPYFKQLSSIAVEAYKKMEKQIPVMYNDIMPHIIAISDEKVRQQQEDKFYSIIANGVLTGIGDVVSSYAIGLMYMDINRCGCDENELTDLSWKKAALEREYQEKQDAHLNSIKSGEIDFNSKWYKDYLSKWERPYDCGLFKYRIGDNYSYFRGGIWTPLGHASHARFSNEATGEYARQSAFGVSGPFSIDVSSQIEGRFVKDEQGNLHPRDTVRKSSVEVTAGKGPLELTLGVSSCIQRGSNVYGKLGLSTGFGLT